MPRPTARGLALLGIAAGTYVAARLVGTWELYLLAFALVAVVLVSWVLVGFAGRRIRIARDLYPTYPVAGDEPELRMVIKNRSWLPGPELTISSPLAGLANDDPELEVEGPAPRARRMVVVRIGQVNRGVHVLPPAMMLAEDPLGLAIVARRVGTPLRVTIHPRLTPLRSCALTSEIGLPHDRSSRRSLLTLGTSEFRAIRPYQPGEPLSHIDWKSTAKTGVLMLRETEEPAGGRMDILLDGTAAQVLGRAPDSSFELAVRAAGSICDFALRAGHTVTLFRHEHHLQRTQLPADENGRSELLEVLAGAQPSATIPLAQNLRRLYNTGARTLRPESLTVVSMSLDHELVHTLIELRGARTHVALLYVAGDTFTRTPETNWSMPLSAETRSQLLALLAAGIPCLTLERGDDLEQIMSLGRDNRTYEAGGR
ncbi:MAG: DUF58 domain-containing protein [Thermoleophilia bacterium]|jgi:uncharacterized protein (DUF58 family)